MVVTDTCRFWVHRGEGGFGRDFLSGALLESEAGRAEHTADVRDPLEPSFRESTQDPLNFDGIMMTP
jgi:hypothetical protein